jgi:FkbM family methyltransferase
MTYSIYETGRGNFLLTDEPDLVSDQMKADQFWEHELEPIFDTLTQDMIVVEVGEYVGDHTVDLAKRCKHVHAFEGHKPSYYLLGANLLLNDCMNVTTYNLCIGNNNKVSGKIPDANNIAAYIYKQSKNGKTTAVRLDDVLVYLDKLDFLKIDVEGMDLEVMLGAQQLIGDFKPRIVYEFSWPLSKQKHVEYESFLKQFGYTTTKLEGLWNWYAHI